MPNGGSCNYSYTFSPSINDDLGRAMNIFTAMKGFSDYAQYLNSGSQIAQCRVSYPTTNGSAYYYGENNIKLGNPSLKVPGYPSVHESWDTIGHEYVHHLQNHFFQHDYTGNHYFDENGLITRFREDQLTENLTEAKKKAIGLCWKESWPTFFSVVAQKGFDADLRSIPNIGDSDYTSFNGVVEELDSFSYNDGEADERSIMSFLYQLWDSESSIYDTISISDSDIWSIMVSTNPEFFYSFISSLHNSGLTFSRDGLGLLLGRFKFSASSVGTSISTNYANLPTFTWNANGHDVYFGGSTYAFGNDRFDLVFFDMNKHEIMTKSGINGTSTTLNQNEWNSVLRGAGSKYYIVIKSYDTLGTTSGPYFSKYYEFEKPVSASSSFTLDNTRLFEKCFTIAPGTYWYFSFSFNQAGTKFIQTLGQGDTEMWLYESDGTTLITSDDDSGHSLNSFMYRYMNSGTNYVLKIGLYSAAASSDVKLIIAPLYGVLDPSHASYDSYESYLNLPYNNYTFSSYLCQWNSKAITWTPQESGNFTLSLTSQYDNYLYVMDPRSANQNVINVNYNDDANGRNAAVTGNYEAGVRYLIVYSQYNPSNSIGNDTVSADILINILKN